MQSPDVACTLRLLQRFYGSYWPEPPRLGGLLEYRVAPYSYDLASQAVRQWYRDTARTSPDVATVPRHHRGNACATTTAGHATRDRDMNHSMSRTKEE